jgi:hypothetical protein
MKTTLKLACAIYLWVISFPAQATTITFNTANISGNQYQYNFVVHNDSLQQNIWDIFIYFESDYSNLAVINVPPAWQMTTNEGLPYDPAGYLRIYTNPASGVTPGNSLTGISMSFYYNGAQPIATRTHLFSIEDYINSPYQSLEWGVTQPAVVPIPASIWLLLSGLIALRAVNRSRSENR